MKPIHNTEFAKQNMLKVVFIISKIQNETNSQHDIYIQYILLSCFYHIKDTK